MLYRTLYTFAYLFIGVPITLLWLRFSFFPNDVVGFCFQKDNAKKKNGCAGFKKKKKKNIIKREHIQSLQAIEIEEY